MTVADRLKGRKTLKVGNFLDEFEKDDIKRDVDIVKLFHHFGVELTKKGKSHLGKCPWHEDTTPSLSVDQDKGLYNCFGCGESGDIFTLTEKFKGLSFKESANYLKEFAGGKSSLPEDTPPLKPASSLSAEDRVKSVEAEKSDAEPGKAEKKEESTNEEAAPVGAAPVSNMSLNTVADYYHKRLFDNTQALEYLKERGFTNMQLFTRFRIGFADGSILAKLSGTHKDSLKRQGIITEKGFEHFKDRVTFPIFDDMDNVTGIYGRSVDEKSKVKHLYLKGKHRSIFNRKASKVYDEIILTESIIDALSLISLGFENVQSIYGTNGFTEEHLVILKDDRVKTVVLAFDADEEGGKASEKLKGKLAGEGFGIKVITPELGQLGNGAAIKDWNDYLKAGGSKEAVSEFLDRVEIFKVVEEEKSFKAEKDQLGYVFLINGVQYRVTGMKEVFVSNLRVNIKAEDGDAGLKYYDNLDLYSARSRSGYAGNMGSHLEIEPKRVEKDLISILEYLEGERDRHLMSGTGKEKERELTPEERELGINFLTNPDMFTEIVEDMNVLGYVGEDLNKQLMYIAATSRKLDDPISVMVVSESASGKSLLIDTVARLIPGDEVISVTSLSEQALNYMEDLSHKFLSLGEIVHSETIEHQIREMLSKRELSRLVTTKEPQTGKMVTKQVKIPAIVALAMSGTKYDMNPENTSRCFMVNADESREQTRRIQRTQQVQKHTKKRDQEKQNLVPAIIKKHHCAQKLLQRLTVDNVFGKYLDFPDTLMRTRRDNDRFIDLIACVCFLRQYQKDRKRDGEQEYIEFDLKDYEIAYSIMINGVLSSSLLDIPRGAIDLYEELRKFAKKLAKKEGVEPHEVSFTQRDIREATGFGQTWLKMHLKCLMDYEYVALSRGGKARSRGYYQICRDVEIESINLSMIPTPEELRKKLQGEK